MYFGCLGALPACNEYDVLYFAWPLMNVLRQAPPDRKSIGAEVNYGVRFDTQAQADGFLSELAVELSRRMAAEGVLGRALTLKIMKQRDVSWVVS